MSSHSYSPSASVATSVITGFIALINSPYVTYAEKLVSVFVLAMVAEGGRRLVTKLVDKKEKK